MSGIPKWEDFMLPVLQVMQDGATRNRRELNPVVAQRIGLSAEQMKETLTSGEPMYENRIGWALSFLTNVGGLERPRRAHYVITEAGQQLLTQFPSEMREQDLHALAQDPTSPIRAYVARTTRATAPSVANVTTDDRGKLTPIEQVQDGIERIRADVAAELLARLQGKEPAFFEDAVVKLLLAMGYGGANGSGAATQLTHDGGIDGVIDQDILGLSRVYVQAKRYADTNSVQRPEVQSFVGALHGRADSGVFITTSHFSPGAVEYAKSTPTRVILVDGAQLVDLMIRFGVGVQTSQTFHAVELDEDFFA